MIPVKVLRELIDGLPDDAQIGVIEQMSDWVDEMTHVELIGAERTDEGMPCIVVQVSMLDETDDPGEDEMES